jgi:hypothetical protein
MARFGKDGRVLIASNVAQADAFRSAGFVEVEEVEAVEPEPEKPKRTRKAKAEE